MPSFEIEFYGKNGEKGVLRERELRFFVAGLAEKPAAFLPIAARLAANRKFSGFALLARAAPKASGGQTLLGAMGNEGYYEFCSGLVGFKPISISCPSVGLKFHTRDAHEFSATFYMVLEVLFLNQYGLSEKNMRGREIIDAGASVGVFSLFAARLGAKKIHAFEPVNQTFRSLSGNIALNRMQGRIIPVNCALGEKPGTARISFQSGCDVSASIEFFDPSKKSQRTKVTTIDRFMAGRGKAGFIKIDSEGYEEKILLGATRTIQKFKPVLCFSAYHKPSDKQRLPQVVKSIRNDYSCTLRHIYEEDFYCE